MMTCAPFQATIDTGELSGTVLKETLEFSVTKTVLRANYDFWQFLQVSGLRFTADLSKPEGSRISNIKVLCQNCTTPVYEDFDVNKTYRIATLSFLVGGGDGYAMIKNNLKNIKKGPVDTNIYEPYIKKMSPINQKVEGRITVLNQLPPN